MGSYVNIPFNGPVHKFTNKTDKTAHILCFTTPAGMEKIFEEIGKPVAPGAFLPPPQMTPKEQNIFSITAVSNTSLLVLPLDNSATISKIFVAFIIHLEVYYLLVTFVRIIMIKREIYYCGSFRIKKLTFV